MLFTYAGTGGFIWLVAFVIPFLITRRYRETSVILTTALGVNYLIGASALCLSLAVVVAIHFPPLFLNDREGKI